jgi:hypothetical protein
VVPVNADVVVEFVNTLGVMRNPEAVGFGAVVVEGDRGVVLRRLPSSRLGEWWFVRPAVIREHDSLVEITDGSMPDAVVPVHPTHVRPVA